MSAAKAKSKYVARKAVEQLRLHSANGALEMRIAAREGSGKFNVAVTIRPTDKDSTEHAQTGARASFDTVEKAKVRVHELGKDAEKKGWKLIPSSGRAGSFTEIPDSPKAKK